MNEIPELLYFYWLLSFAVSAYVGWNYGKRGLNGNSTIEPGSIIGALFLVFVVIPIVIAATVVAISGNFRGLLYILPTFVLIWTLIAHSEGGEELIWLILIFSVVGCFLGRAYARQAAVKSGETPEDSINGIDVPRNRMKNEDESNSLMDGSS